MRARTLLALSLVFASALCSAQNYKFIITGDDRAAGIPGRAGYDENGVNKTVLQELVQQTLHQKAKFILFSGDLVLGYTSADTFRSQLQTWVKIMDPIYDAGVHVYVVRGNHDAFSKDDENVWQGAFNGRYAMPHNGPDTEKDATWSAVEQNSLLIGVDEWGTHVHQVNQPWLDQQLAANKQPHIFVIGHEMAFKAGHHDDNLDNHPEARDSFVKSLIAAGCTTYICGHDHFYDHMLITDPTSGKTIHQLLVGTAGAPFYTGDKYDGNNGSWKLTPVKHIEDTFGYTLVEIKGLHVKMTFMGRKAPGVYAPMETFSYTDSPK
jgi:predicted phosphodiesterase